MVALVSRACLHTDKGLLAVSALLPPTVPDIYQTQPAEPTMTEKLYTRVTKDFDPAAPTGVLVCAARLDETYGFSQNGYDSVDYDEEPDVYEVVLSVCLEEDPINRLLERDDFRAAMDEAAIGAIQDHVVVITDQPRLTMLWNPETYRLKGPLDLVPAAGADSAQHVRLAHDPIASTSYGGPRR